MSHKLKAVETMVNAVREYIGPRELGGLYAMGAREIAMMNALDAYEAALAESQAAGEDLTIKDLKAAFDDYWLHCEGPSMNTTGRDGYEIWVAACNWLRSIDYEQLAAAQARIAGLNALVVFNEKTNEELLSRVAVLEKALDADKARLDFLDTLPKHGGWDLQCNGYGYPHLLDTTYGTKIREAIDTAKPEILAAALEKMANETP